MLLHIFVIDRNEGERKKKESMTSQLSELQALAVLQETIYVVGLVMRSFDAELVR